MKSLSVKKRTHKVRRFERKFANSKTVIIRLINETWLLISKSITQIHLRRIVVASLVKLSVRCSIHVLIVASM